MSASAAIRAPLKLDSLALYALALLALACLLAGGLMAMGAGLGGPIWGICVLAAVALLAERQTVRLTANVELTVSSLPLLFAAVVFGPLAAMMVGAIGLAGDFGRPYTRWVIWTALRSLSGGLSGLSAQLVISETRSLGGLFAACFVAVVVEQVVDSALGSVTIHLRKVSPVSDYLRSVRPLILAAIPLYAPVIGMLAYAYSKISTWSVLLFVGPAVAAHSFYRLYYEQRKAVEELASANDRLAKANLSFATALVATLEARDRYTAGHSEAVAVYAKDIAARLGLSEEEQELARVCGLVHDIGKVGLPAKLLEKRGPLSLEERQLMAEHSIIGEKILAKVEDYEEIAKIVRHHHERWDGYGYPDGLRGTEIPLISRIIAVADAYNAMTSDRPYRDAMPSRVARLRLAQAVESQFDTSVVAAFEAILASASEDYRTGRRDDVRVRRSEKRLGLPRGRSEAAL